jgi:hypothetical protein
MSTLSANSNVTLLWSSWDTLNVVSNFGQNWRYVWVPEGAEYTSIKALSRSFGPGAENVTIGRFGGPGAITLYNDSTSTLTYFEAKASLAVSTLTVNQTLTANNSVTMNPSNANVSIAPTGTGTVSINPASAGSIDNCALGATTPRAVRTIQLQMLFTDSSGTPGAVTNNSPRGRVAIAAAASSVTVTNGLAAATSTVIAKISQNLADTTLTSIVRIYPFAGGFTIFGNAAATANTVIDYVLIN